MTFMENCMRKIGDQRFFNCFWQKSLLFHIKSLFYYGIWPVDDEPKTAVYFCRHGFFKLEMVRCMYTLLFHSFSIYLLWGNGERMIEFCGVMSVTLVVVVRLGSLYTRKHQLSWIFKTLQYLHEPQFLNNDFLKETAAHADNNVYKGSYLYTVFHIISGVFNFIGLVALSLKTRTVPFRYWLPYNYGSTPIFEITLVMIHLLGLIDIFLVAQMMCTFVALTISIIVQYRLLRYKVDNIKRHVEIKIDKSMRLHKNSIIQNPRIENALLHVKNVLQVRKFVSYIRKTEARRENDSTRHLFLSGLGNCKYVPNTRIQTTRAIGTPIQRKVDSPGKEVKPNSNLRTTNKVNMRCERRCCSKVNKVADRVSKVKVSVNNIQSEMELYLRHCVQHHQTILKLTRELQHVFKPILGCQVFTLTSTGFFALYITTLSSQMDIKVLVFLFVIFCLYVEFFVVCWFGNEITAESEMLRESVYGCEWFEASASFKKTIRIMISRMNRPEVLKAGGLPLSIRSFRFMCRTGYYLHNVIDKLIHGVKIIKKNS